MPMSAKKISLLILLLAVPCWAENNFAADPNCVGWYQFENGALTTDSSGENNTLTASASSPTSNTSDYKQGAGSADFEFSTPQYFSRADADLSAGFPFKTGDANLKGTMTCWVKIESWGATDIQRIVKKMHATAGGFSFGQTTFASTLEGGLIAGGAYRNHVLYGGNAETAHWYWIVMQWNDVPTASRYWHRFAVWNDTDNVWFCEYTGVDGAGEETPGLGDLSATDEPFFIGNPFDGLIDEMTIWNRVLTLTELEEIRTGVFGSGGGQIMRVVSN